MEYYMVHSARVSIAGSQSTSHGQDRIGTAQAHNTWKKTFYFPPRTRADQILYFLLVLKIYGYAKF